MTYFICLDLSKFKHDCFIMNENGEVIRDSFSFENNREGFNTFLNVLANLDPIQEKRIGFESTGHYGSNLKIFLERNSYSFVEFNSLLVHRHFKSESLRRTKNDKVDARKISLYLSSREYKPNPNSSYHLKCLKSLTRMRDSLISERTRQLIWITNILDKMFPEFKPLFNNQGIKASSAIYLLENYGTPSRMANMTGASYDKMKSELRRTISYAKFCKIKELARNTVGNEDEILTFELNVYLKLPHKFPDSVKRFIIVNSLGIRHLTTVHFPPIQHIFTFRNILQYFFIVDYLIDRTSMSCCCL